jgi:hypothetical protein
MMLIMVIAVIFGGIIDAVVVVVVAIAVAVTASAWSSSAALSPQSSSLSYP